MGFVQLNNLTEGDFKEELSTVERKGMKAYIDEIFRDRFGWSPISLCYFTDSNNYEIFTYQDNDTEIADGVYLSHFALTNSGMVVAVGYDEEREEYFYRID